MTAIMDTHFMEQPYVLVICRVFRIHTYYEVMMLLLAALIVIYIFKNAYLFLEYYLQYRFVIL